VPKPNPRNRIALAIVLAAVASVTAGLFSPSAHAKKGRAGAYTVASTGPAQAPAPAQPNVPQVR
jgi:hypothetical protein